MKKLSSKSPDLAEENVEKLAELFPNVASEKLDEDGKTVLGALIACLEEQLGDDLVMSVAKRKPLRALFRDSSFTTDAERINAEQIFAEVSSATDVRTI